MIKYFIFILVLFYSCNNIEKDPTIKFSNFPKEEDITLHNFIKYDHGIISRFFVTDKSLFAYDWRAKDGYFFYEYDLQSKQNTRKYIPHGRGKGKALGSLSSGIYENYLWIYDISLSKIIFADFKLQTIPNGSDSAKEYSFRKKYYNIQFLNDTKIIANGNYQTPNIIEEIELSSGKTLTGYGLLDSVPKGIPFYAWKRANEAFMVLKPTQDKAVLANRFNDNIEIFDLKTHESIKVRGPENYKIEFGFFKSEDSIDLIQRNEKSRYGFVRVMTTNKNIYALYSGNNRNSNFIDYSKTLYIYDWEGRPVKKINLDRYVSGFAVSSDNKVLYAFDVKSNFIVTAKI